MPFSQELPVEREPRPLFYLCGALPERTPPRQAAPRPQGARSTPSPPRISTRVAQALGIELEDLPEGV
jgi:hypothetical protein